MSDLTSIIPAAGLGTRMRGGDKLLEPVSGIPQLRRVAEMARSVCRSVLVTVPEPAGARGAALDGLDVIRIPVPDAHLGMSRSLVRAAAALPDDAGGILILPADMPEITADDLARLAARFHEMKADRILRAATEDGMPGHPVLFPARFRSALLTLGGDEGARELLAREAQAGRVSLLPLAGQRARIDLDTPEDWAAWRAAQAAKSARD